MNDKYDPNHFCPSWCKCCEDNLALKGNNNHITKIISIFFCRTKGGANPIIVTFAHDTSSFGYFKRSTVREMTAFFARTFLKRTPPGCRQSVDVLSAPATSYICHCYNRPDGLGACFVTEKAYPPRVAFVLLTRLLKEFNQKTLRAMECRNAGHFHSFSIFGQGAGEVSGSRGGRQNNENSEGFG